jgi:hypothetical protein
MIRYRLLHVGAMLSMWRLDEMNRGTLIAAEENACGEDHCVDLDCEPCRASCDAAVNRLSIAAEADYGTWLPWIAGDERTSTVVYTGPLREKAPA